jgi:transcriptional regulator with XRE-family HTH domain
MSTRELKAAMRSRGLSQFDLARASGVHTSTISRAVAGMKLSADAERRVLDVLEPHNDAARTPLQTVVSADA